MSILPSPPSPLSQSASAVRERCQSITMILSDVDGVLTDGGIVLDSEGVETKRFNIRDGLGIRLWQQAGYDFGLITLRRSPMVDARAAELGIEIVYQAAGDKVTSVRQILEQYKIRPQQVCFVGDDLPDLPPIRAVGLGVAVADACDELRAAAHYVTQTPGGAGAVREVIELLLKAQNRWEEVIRKYDS
jgi:3-deoxy-D-manno-octulosonate 8-phosphate phosphatase (KDO 8-P phosphatase)